MNILFTCGGTAGHINPAVALARLFQERNPGCRILFVGADGGMETRLVPKEGYDICTVTITNFQRSLTPAAVGHNLKTLFNMNRSRKQANAKIMPIKRLTRLPNSPRPSGIPWIKQERVPRSSTCY